MSPELLFNFNFNFKGYCLTWTMSPWAVCAAPPPCLWCTPDLKGTQIYNIKTCDELDRADGAVEYCLQLSKTSPATVSDYSGRSTAEDLMRRDTELDLLVWPSVCCRDTACVCVVTLLYGLLVWVDTQQGWCIISAWTEACFFWWCHHCAIYIVCELYNVVYYVCVM